MVDDARQDHFDPTTYLDLVTTDIPKYEELQSRTADASTGIEVHRVLELGVGTGETSVRVLARHVGADLVGIDENAAMLAVAAERLPDADLRVAKLAAPLPEGDFDLVVSALTVHHLDASGKADLFARVFGRLRPGGRFVLTDVIVPEDPNDVTIPVDGVHDKPSSIAEQIAWAEEAGFNARLDWSFADFAVIVADRP